MKIIIKPPHPRAGQLADVEDPAAAEFNGGFFVRPRRPWKVPATDNITSVTWLKADEFEILEKAA